VLRIEVLCRGWGDVSNTINVGRCDLQMCNVRLLVRLSGVLRGVLGDILGLALTKDTGADFG